MADNKSQKNRQLEAGIDIQAGRDIAHTTIIIGDGNTVASTARSISEPQAQGWLKALNELRSNKQIGEKDYLSVLSHALGKQIETDIDPQSFATALAECQDPDERFYWHLPVENLSGRVVTQKNARAHQILTALNLNLEVALTDFGVRFVLIPPGKAQNGVVNGSCFYLAETVLMESDWERIANGKDSNEGTPRPRLNLSLNEVRQLLNRANERPEPPGRWAIPTSKQWLFAVNATEVIAHRQRSLALKANPPSPFGVYDLLGVVWQFCSSNKRRGEFVVQGGTRFTIFNSADEIPRPEPVAGNDLEGEDWGFRPALLL